MLGSPCVFVGIFYVNLVTDFLTNFIIILVPISIAVAIKDYESQDKNYLSFEKGDKITIFGKYIGTDNTIWQGSLV